MSTLDQHRARQHCTQCGRLKHAQCFERVDAVCTVCLLPERQRQQQDAELQRSEAALNAKRQRRDEADRLRGLADRPARISIGA